MTADIVNLRLARKRRARADASKQAELNRAAHGISKAEHDRAKAKTDRETRHLDGHRLDRHRLDDPITD